MAFQDQGTRMYGPATARVFLHQFRHGADGKKDGQKGSQGRGLMIAATILAFLGVVAAGVAVAVLLAGRTSAAGQIQQLQDELNAEQAKVAALAGAESGNAQQLHSVSGKVGTISGKIRTIDGALAYLAQFNQTCTQGTNSSTYWSPCANHAPAPAG